VDSRGRISDFMKGKKTLSEPEVKNRPVTQPIPGHCSDRDNE